jgi:hypothetical protein
MEGGMGIDDITFLRRPARGRVIDVPTVRDAFQEPWRRPGSDAPTPKVAGASHREHHHH